jgi:hypothetical protein
MGLPWAKQLTNSVYFSPFLTVSWNIDFTDVEATHIEENIFNWKVDTNIILALCSVDAFRPYRGVFSNHSPQIKRLHVSPVDSPSTICYRHSVYLLTVFELFTKTNLFYWPPAEKMVQWKARLRVSIRGLLALFVCLEPFTTLSCF